MSLVGKTWEYINEGNIHIVIGIKATDYVIRLLKDEENAINLENIKNATRFVNLIMIPLLFGDYVYKEDLITLSKEDVARLSLNLVNLRPKYRQIKSTLSQYAIKAPNLTMINPSCDNFCIEIKPKEGFMSANFAEYSKCYYCLKQFSKLAEKQIDNISDYCPLDLFSGDRIRMKQALLHLLQNPQNNIKLFTNGNIVYNEKSKLIDLEKFLSQAQIFKSVNTFIDFIINILINNDNFDDTIEESLHVSLNQKSEKCTESTSLSNNSFLHKLLTLQKLSETNINPEGDNGNCDYVSILLKLLSDHKLNLINMKDKAKFIKIVDPIHLALISAVAKDCSIMITFATKSDRILPYIKIREQKVFYRIFITDLEPKSIETLVKRKKTEQKLISLYDNYKKNTIIQPHSETRTKQLDAWQELISNYLKVTKQSTIDIRESQNSPLFNNPTINRKLSSEALLLILEDMGKNGKAAPIDKSKNVWEIYWHSLDEWGNMIYNWASCNGLNNSVCTLFELREGDNTVAEEFHGLDMNILVKALKSLEVKGKCELMEFDENQGVKFF